LFTGQISHNPAKQVKGGVRPKKHLTGSISRDEVDALFSVIDTSTPVGLRDTAILNLMVRCGLSEIEIVRINLEDLTGTKSDLRVYVQGKNKDKKDEYVRVPPPVEQILNRYLANRGQSEGNTPLFWGIGNRAIKERISTRGLRARIKEYFELAGINRGGITPYSLRHTAAIMAIQNGATVSEIKNMLRLKTTEAALVYFEEAKELDRQT